MEFGSRLLLLTMALAFLLPPASADDTEELDFFESKIRPVLVEHCYQCHSVDATNIRGGLLLDSQEGTLAGGDSGPAVVPGEPSESLILDALRYESFEMPPDQKLADEIVADFETWIEDGAIDPRTGGQTIEKEEIDLVEGRKFWSFQPFHKPDVPAATKWAHTEIDAFISAQHSVHELTPTADATANQLARRLYFDLVGLPPSVEQLDRFSAAHAADPEAAIAGLADELLATPQFGQRWARHWLDVTRFAESSGGGRSLMFPHAWRFRNYVIDSFNDDKPLPRLIREHIAGDLIPADSDAQRDEQITGVGYLALGPTNYEQQDKELLVMEVIDEQIDTIGRTFLGQTIGCARCHDHKFDPIPTADYYALGGIFRSTLSLTPGNVSGYVTTSLQSGDAAEVFRQWKEKQTQLKASIGELESRITSGQPVRGNIDPKSLPGIIVDDTEAEFIGDWIYSSQIKPWVGAGYRHDMFKKAGRQAIFRAKLPKSGRYTVRMCHNYHASRCSRLPITVAHAGGESTVEIDQRLRPADGVFSEIGTFEFNADEEAVITIDADSSGEGVVIVDAIQFLPEVADDKPDDAKQQAKITQEIAQLKKELRQHEKSEPSASTVMIVKDADAPSDGHLHIRGGVRQLGPVVPRGFLSVISEWDDSGEPVPPQIPEETSGRLELANWIASPDNPLTARVYVNRVWMHLLGQGIVRTPDSFGQMGQRPTHPKLLDYLAHTFVTADDWSTKKLIRRIVTSRVYRLSSTEGEAAASADPRNTWLARANRRRLEAEAIRDAILSVSGDLDISLQDRTIGKVSQYDNGYDHDKYSTGIRSVYVPAFRNSVLPLFDVYDSANPNLVSGKRSESTLPSQALFMLNSPFVLEQSRRAAKRFVESNGFSAVESSNLAETMLQHLARKVLSRNLTALERDVLMPTIDTTQVSKAETWTPIVQALLASADFRYLE